MAEAMLVGPDDAFAKQEGQVEMVGGRSWHARLSPLIVSLALLLGRGAWQDAP